MKMVVLLLNDCEDSFFSLFLPVCFVLFLYSLTEDLLEFLIPSFHLPKFYNYSMYCFVMLRWGFGGGHVYARQLNQLNSILGFIYEDW